MGKTNNRNSNIPIYRYRNTITRQYCKHSYPTKLSKPSTRWNKLKSTEKGKNLNFAFEDENDDYENVNKQIILSQGENEIVDLITQYTQKNISVIGNTSIDASGIIKVNGEEIGNIYTDDTGTVIENLNHYRFSKNDSLLVDIDLTAPFADQEILSKYAKHDVPVEINELLNRHYNTKVEGDGEGNFVIYTAWHRVNKLVTHFTTIFA